MAHITADAQTSLPASSIHAGLNSVPCTYALGGTSSGSVTVALCPLPAGAQVVNVRHCMSNNGIGTGGELVSVWANIGGMTTPVSAQYQFILSAAAIGYVATSSTILPPNIGKDIGKRITASANLFCRYTNQVGTGTSTVSICVVVDYLASKRGD